MRQRKHKFGLFSAVLTTVCIVLETESVAPTASIGHSQYFWWAVMLVGFFVPYALISAELCTQYPSEGGIYTWIKRAFGEKWAARMTWFYWVDYPIWIASLANLITSLLMVMLGVELQMWMVLLIQIAYIVLVTLLGMMRISQSDWISNIGAVIKFVILGGIGLLGFYILFTKGTANPVEAWQDFVPLVSTDGGIDWMGLRFVALIIFNLLGFEVVGTFYYDMDKPRKQIPQAIIYGGILIAICYLLPSFALGVGTRFGEISTDTGLLDAWQILMTNAGFGATIIQAIIALVGGLLIVTLISDISSWNFGVYSVVACAAEDEMFPKPLTKRNKEGVPYMVGIWTAIAAIVLVLVGVLLTYVFPGMVGLSNMFWAFFSLSLVCQLLSYMPVFAAFIKLHKEGRQKKTGYWLNVGSVMRWVMGMVPLMLMMVALFFTLIPELSWEAICDNATLLVSVVLCAIIGEMVVGSMSRRKKRRK